MFKITRMQFPESLKKAIERETGRFSQKEMIEASASLSACYQQQLYGFPDQARRIAYLAVRMPATFAAISHVLLEVRNRIPGIEIKSLLDLGAGPGTGMWAAREIFPEIEQMTLLEMDRQLIDLGKRLALDCPDRAIQKAQWQIQNLETQQGFSPHDLVLFSYSIGELSPSSTCLEKAWAAARKMIVIIEPGTPTGFARIQLLRSQLIDLGAHIIAPCPHAGQCPMSKDDWCHFSQRLERSSLHRRMKEGELGYEDEKFSYLVFAKEPVLLPENRVLRHPLKRTGHVALTLCTREGYKQTNVSKKSEIYKLARKFEWGSSF